MRSHDVAWLCLNLFYKRKRLNVPLSQSEVTIAHIKRMIAFTLSVSSFCNPSLTKTPVQNKGQSYLVCE